MEEAIVVDLATIAVVAAIIPTTSRSIERSGTFAEAVSIRRTMRGEAASGVISPRPAGFTPAAFFRRYRNQIGLRRFVIWG